MTATHTDLQTAFKSAMAGVATPVSVVTAIVDDHPYGTTVSAFASLSIEPPMVLVSLGRGSETLKMVHLSGTFGLNVLGAAQSATATSFARKGGAAKFEGISWEIDNGLPRVVGAPGWIVCTVASLVDGGDHVVVLGNVIAADAWEGTPLVYHRRQFGTHIPHAGDN